MTNKLRYFIGNWIMFGDFGSFKIIHKINQFSYKSKNRLKCAPPAPACGLYLKKVSY